MGWFFLVREVCCKCIVFDLSIVICMLVVILLFVFSFMIFFGIKFWFGMFLNLVVFFKMWEDLDCIFFKDFNVFLVFCFCYILIIVLRIIIDSIINGLVKVFIFVDLFLFKLESVRRNEILVVVSRICINVFLNCFIIRS